MRPASADQKTDLLLLPGAPSPGPLHNNAILVGETGTTWVSSWPWAVWHGTWRLANVLPRFTLT